MRKFQSTIRVLAVTSSLMGLAASGTFTAGIGTAESSVAHIEFSSTTVGFQVLNTRAPGSTENALIYFIAATRPGGGPAPIIDVTSSNPSLITVTKMPVANALGNYILSVPANAPVGTAMVTATTTVDGVFYSRSRAFDITASVVAPPPPPGSATTNRATTPTTTADQSGCATINYYDVGPGRPYSGLGKVPWSRLKGCDTVRIYARPGNGTYNEMLLISAGTDLAPTAPNRFMRVIGVPDPVTGALPIIDGTNATQLETLPGQAPRSLQYHDNNNAGRALYKLGLVMVGPQLGYNYSNGPAGYIGIENLDIRNSTYGAPFSDGRTGAPSSYSSFGSCLYVEAAAHLVVKNNLLHNCGNGLFINSKNSTVVELSQDVLIDGNSFYDNSNAPIPGVSNGYSEHNSYTEARDITFQYNYFGDVRPGAFGDCLKDRSSGLTVRYNTFASTCNIQLNLLDSTGGQALIWGDAGYAKTYVYGNLFDLAPAPEHNTNLAVYGGDSSVVAHYRRGTLLFYNNTMVVEGNAGHGIYPETFMFNMLVAGAVADVKNNVFQASPGTPSTPGKIQAMAMGPGTVNLANNWVSPNAAPFWIGHLNGAVLNGWSTNLGSGNNPHFVNAAQHDYRPAAGSPLINAGAGLASLPASALPVFEPDPIVARKLDPKIDIGAYEY